MLIDIALRIWVDVDRERPADLALDLEEYLEPVREYFAPHTTTTAVRTFVITTISSRGRSCCLMAFPRMISERPLL